MADRGKTARKKFRKEHSDPGKKNLYELIYEVGNGSAGVATINTPASPTAPRKVFECYFLPKRRGEEVRVKGE